MKFLYETEEEREQIMKYSKDRGYTLKSVIEGLGEKYLEFDTNVELKVSNLEEENFNIMLATTEMYEEQYNENLNLMLAIIELYEMNMEV